MIITDGRQLKAARVILGMTIRDMAEAAGMHRNSVWNTENRERLPHHSWTADRLQEELEARGIVFGNDSGMVSVSFKTYESRDPVKYRKHK